MTFVLEGLFVVAVLIGFGLAVLTLTAPLQERRR